jgi:hypothetical protein
VRAVLAFLEHVPDRARAGAAMEKFGRLVLDGGHVALDRGAAGHVRFPLDFAPRPTSVARSLFSPEVVDRHLDALAEREDADAGRGFSFATWTPITRFEWGGWVTLESLLILRDNGRL